MSFFDSGLVNFIKLLIIVGLISMLYMIMMQKIKEQNHKISSLLSLVTTMAHEITALKQPTLPEEKNEISDDSDSESESDSDSDTDSDSVSEPIDLEEIDLVKGDKITMLESEDIPDIIPEFEFHVETVINSMLESIDEPVESNSMELYETFKKMNTNQLMDLVVSKGLKTKQEAKKMKKGDLLKLLE